jgi:RHS repeat-associated protein
LLTTANSGNAILQDLNYTYDPVGNISRQFDNAQKTVFYGGQQVEAQSDYIYDAIYRLVQSNGRDHIGQVTYDQQDNWGDNWSNLSLQPNSPVQMRNYVEKYFYDGVGNISKMQHIAGNPATPPGNWTRTYQYNASNNQLIKTTAGGQNYTYTYNAHGSMLSMPQLQLIDWNFQEEMQHANLGGGGDAWYVYDSSGQRIRKVIERPDGTIEERIYLSGYEIYRERSGINITLQRDTLHIMDDKSRIAMVETRTKGNDGSPKQLVRYQYNNHLGSACLELDDTAKIITYEEYHPYGTSAYRATDASRQVPLRRYRYTGMERDDETGLNYHMNRYYAPWLGRWMATDPGGLIDGLNLYKYCRDNPIMHNDPNGMDPPVVNNMNQNDPNNYVSFEDFRTGAAGPWTESGLRDAWDEAHPTAPPSGGAASSSGSGGSFDGGAGGAPGHYSAGGSGGTGGAPTSDSSERSGLVTAVGGIQAVGGGFEMYGGAVAGLAACPETFGVGCVVAVLLFLHGADTASSGLNTMYQGDRVSLTYTNRTGQAAASLVTDDPTAQHWVGAGVDMTAGLGLSFGTAALVDIPAASGSLVHLTDPAAVADLTAPGAVFRGPSGIYAGPASNAAADGVGVTLRTGLSPLRTYGSVPIPPSAAGSFVRPLPMGPITLWQNLTGQVHTGAGLLDMTTGAFTRTGVLYNHALFYGADAALTVVPAATTPVLSIDIDPQTAPH